MVRKMCRRLTLSGITPTLGLISRMAPDNSEQTFLYMYIVTCKYKQIVIHQRQSDTLLICRLLTKVVTAWSVAGGRQDS